METRDGTSDMGILHTKKIDVSQCFTGAKASAYQLLHLFLFTQVLFYHLKVIGESLVLENTGSTLYQLLLTTKNNPKRESNERKGIRTPAGFPMRSPTGFLNQKDMKSYLEPHAITTRPSSRCLSRADLILSYETVKKIAGKCGIGPTLYRLFFPVCRYLPSQQLISLSFIYPFSSSSHGFILQCTTLQGSSASMSITWTCLIAPNSSPSKLAQCRYLYAVNFSYN